MLHKLTRILLIIAVSLFVSLSMSEGGSFPQLLNYQGTLTDNNGSPVQDGQYSIVFSIYNVATGGTPQWTETWNSGTSPVATVGGNFNVLLGSHTQIPETFFSDNPTTYLGIKVGNDSEMLPRQRIASAAYAFTAGTGGIPKGGIIMWSGSVASIPSGWALCDSTNGTPDLRDRFIVGAGGGYAVAAAGGAASINIAHSHTVNSHSHTVPALNTSNYSWYGGVAANTGVPPGSDYLIAMHNHPDTGVASPSTDSQLSSPQGILPPYYALAFIMKL